MIERIHEQKEGSMGMSIKPENLALRCLREVADEGDTNDQLTESQWVITLWGELKSVDRTGLLTAAMDVADSYEGCHWQDACSNKRFNDRLRALEDLAECNRWGYRAHLLRKALGIKDHWEPARLSHIAR